MLTYSNPKCLGLRTVPCLRAISTSILNYLSIFLQAHLLAEDDWEELLLASDDEEVHEDDGTGTRQRGRK